LVHNLEDCHGALKDSMMHNFVLLDFVKDL